MICAGRWNCPGHAERKARSERSGGRYIGLSGILKVELWLDCLQSRRKRTQLVSSVLLAEVRSFFPSDDACRKALRGIGLGHSPFTEEASLLAGGIFRTYPVEGGTRKTILPDFLVAAHAATQADSLATEDRGYLRSYFPAVRLLTVDRS